MAYSSNINPGDSTTWIKDGAANDKSGVVVQGLPDGVAQYAAASNETVFGKSLLWNSSGTAKNLGSNSPLGAVSYAASEPYWEMKGGVYESTSAKCFWCPCWMYIQPYCSTHKDMLSFSLQMQHSTFNEAFGNEESSHPQIREIGVARRQAAQLSAEAEAAKLAVAEAKREEELAIEKAEEEAALAIEKAEIEAALKIKEAKREAELKIEKAKTDAKKEAALKIEKANWEAKQAAAEKAQAKLDSMAKQGPPRLEIWLQERMTLMSSNARCGGTRLL